MIASTRSGFVVAAVALMTVLLTAGEASAHANYDSSTPAKGEVLDASPSQVEITFTQDVQKVSGTYGIEVTDSANASVTAGESSLSDANRSIMSVPLQPALAVGRYVVHWTNVSDSDGDAAEGAFSFYVGVQPTAADLAADEELAAVGHDEATPTPQSTPSEKPASSATSPAASSTVVAPEGNDDDGDGERNTWIIVGIVVVVAAAGIVAWSRRQA